MPQDGREELAIGLRGVCQKSATMTDMIRMHGAMCRMWGVSFAPQMTVWGMTTPTAVVTWGNSTAVHSGMMEEEWLGS